MPVTQVANPVRLPGSFMRRTSPLLRQLTHYLGQIERYYIARSHLGYYNNVGVTATYTIPPSLISSALRTAGCFSAVRNITYQALAQVILHHPSLGISVTGAGTQNPSWNRLESIDLSSVVTFTHDKVTEELLTTQYNQPILGANGTSPLWRIFVTPMAPAMANGTETSPAPFKITIGFFYHHAIGDGLSGAAFHQSFFPALIAALRNLSKVPPTVVHPPTTDLPPAFETAVPLSITLGGLLRVGYGMLFPTRGIWTGLPISYSPQDPVTTKLSIFSLSPSQTVALTALCKQHGTTVTALLTVVIAEVLAQVLKDVDGLSASIAVSLRKFAKGVGKQDMGTYVSGFSCKFLRSSAKGKGRLGGGVEWEEAKRVKNVLVKGARTTQNQLSGFLKIIPNILKFLQDRAGKPRDGSFEVSNLGVIELDEGGDDEAKGDEEKVGCERVIFGQSANVMGPACSFSIATVKGGEMSVLLSWQVGVVEDGVVEEVMMELERWLTTELLKKGEANGV